MGYINIPVELCEYAIRIEFYRPMQLYIYLKTSCGGKVKKRDMDLQSIGEAIGLTSERAVKNNLKILLEHNWLGYNKRSKIYFIRGFEKIGKFCGIQSTTAAEFDSREIGKLKAFMAAAKIGYLINCQKRNERVIELKCGGSNHVTRKSSGFYPVANEALAKILGISISTAYELKQMAKNAGYIEIRKTFIKTGLQADHAAIMKECIPEHAKKIIVRDNALLLQGKDMVRCKIHYTNRKKRETYIVGNSKCQGK